MRFLFATTSGAGHTAPLIPFAHAARRAGHQVMLAGQDAAAPLAEDAGLRFWPVAGPSPEDVTRFRAGQASLSVDEAMARAASGLYAGLYARAAFPGMVAAIHEWHPDVVIRDSSEFASLVAAERLGVPRAHVDVALATQMMDRMMSMVRPALDDLRASAGMRGFTRSPELRLTMAPASLDGPTPSRMIRRFRDPAAAWAPSLWLPWGDPAAPLVFLSFGSEVPSKSRQFYPSLYREALAELSELNLRILVTTGGRDPHELGPLPDSVRAERWVPQAAVLRDAAVMVGHGGAGSTLGALAAGVPTAFIPQFADQPFNARRVAARGAGIALDGVAGLGDAVRRMLSFEIYADRAGRIRDEIQALPSVDEAIDLLCALADTRVNAA